MLVIDYIKFTTKFTPKESRYVHLSQTVQTPPLLLNFLHFLKN